MCSTAKRNLYKGTVITLAATLLVCLLDVLAKTMVAIYSPFQISFLRSLIGFMIICGYIAVTGNARELSTRRPGLHCIRAVFTLALYVIFFYAIAHIPLVEIEAIAHSAPFYVALLAPVLLNEKVAASQWLAILTGFGGIMIILRPDPARFHIAYVYMVFAAMAYAGLLITARKMRDSETLLAMNFYMYPLAVIVLAYFGIANWQRPEPLHWLAFITMGIFGALAIFLFIYAIQFIEATQAAVLDYFTLAWASIFGYLFWHEFPDALTLAGIFLIVVSGIYIIRHSARATDESLIESLDH